MPNDASDRGGIRVLLMPEDGGESRSFRVGRRTLRWAAGGAVVLLLLLAVMAGSWWYLAVRAARASELEVRVALLEDQEERVRALARRLREAESRYDRIRGLFGSDTSRVASELWLPPVGGTASGRAAAEGPGPPRSWPLTRRGFITQPLVRNAGREHEGLDIAVPSHSYIRAAGAGEVTEVGEDPVYGRFVVLDHGEGYRSLYGHASRILVEEGSRVRANEVIGLSGSTGRSTAPHLHFEILHDGEAVDPLTLVRQP